MDTPLIYKNVPKYQPYYQGFFSKIKNNLILLLNLFKKKDFINIIKKYF
jgi:hypothetical protein